MVEAFGRSYLVPVAILRPFNTYGPRQSHRAVIPTVICQALDPTYKLIEIDDTSTVRDFTFVEDVVGALLTIGVAPKIEFGRAYNLGSGKATSTSELVDLVIDLIGCKKPIVHDACAPRTQASELGGLLVNNRRLTAATGWQPSVDLRDGLKRTIAWWRDRLPGLIDSDRKSIT
jgi:UDP-glucose 4-epimerase